MAKTTTNATPPAAEPPAAPPPAPTPDEQIAELRETVRRLEALVMTRAAAGDKGAADALQEEKSRKEQDAIAAEVEKGVKQRTQDVADRMFPRGEATFSCVLPDGNGHPEIVIRADNDTDAAARYMKVCGILSAEKPVIAVRV